MTDLHTVLLVAAGVLGASFCFIMWQRNRHYLAFMGRCSPPDPAMIRGNPVEDTI